MHGALRACCIWFCRDKMLPIVGSGAEGWRVRQARMDTLSGEPMSQSAASTLALF